MEVNNVNYSGESADNLDVSEDSIVFPLPVQRDESLCRDAFLRSILKGDSKKESSLTSLRPIQRSNVFSSRRRSTGLQTTGEGLAVLRMIEGVRWNERMKSTTSEQEYKATLSAADRRYLFNRYLKKLQKAAVEFLSVRLRKILEIFTYTWPGEVVKTPQKLFNWSEEYFLQRLKINQLYLEVLQIERSEEDLNCVKFCTDILEIIRILNAIMDDYLTDRDLCKGAIKLIKDGNYDIRGTWVTDIQEMRNESESLVKACLTYQLENDHICEDSNANSMDQRDAYLPIEVRYRLNWVTVNEEYHLHTIQSKEQAQREELEKIKSLIKEDTRMFEDCQLSMHIEIDKYRVQIADWEERLETDLENLQLKYDMTRQHCNKIVDDLKYYTSQVEMFRERVDEVRDELAADKDYTRRRSIKFSQKTHRARLNSSSLRKSTLKFEVY